MTVDEMAQQVLTAVRGFIVRELAPVLEKVKTLEERQPVNGRDGVDGRDGREGKDGRDAADLPISIGLDADKSYPLGSFVAAAGGLLRAVRPTSPVGEDGDLEAAGWAVVVNGIRGITMEMEDGGRRMKSLIWTTCGERSIEHKTAIPVERGVHRDGRTYDTGDVVEWAGEAWIAEKDLPEGKPGDGDGWRRLVRRGREGKQGPKGEDGSFVRVAK